MAQASNKGVDSGFIELAQEQLDTVNTRLVEIDQEVAALREEQATLLGQRAHLEGLVDPSIGADEVSSSKVDVQATRDAVVDLIRARGTAMHFRDDIYPSLVAAGHKIGGQDPASTLLSRIIADERLHRTGRGEYGLAEWSNPVSSPVRPIPIAETSGSKVIEAAAQALRDAGEPLHYREIAKRTLRDGMWKTSAKVPDSAMRHALNRNIEKYGGKSLVIKIRRGVFGLRGRDDPAA